MCLSLDLPGGLQLHTLNSVVLGGSAGVLIPEVLDRFLPENSHAFLGREVPSLGGLLDQNHNFNIWGLGEGHLPLIYLRRN